MSSQQIADAIRNHHVLRINYDMGDRTIEPHALGIGKSGQELLRAYQVDGASSSGNRSGWKLFRVDQIASIGGVVGSFDGPRSGYNPNDSAMDRIIECV